MRIGLICLVAAYELLQFYRAVLRAAYFIFARNFPPAVFATLAAAIIGFASLGKIAGFARPAWAVD